MAHGRMSGERTRQLDYATIGKTEVALKYGCRSASERWEGLYPKGEKGENHEQFRRAESEEKRAWAKDK